MKKIIQLLFFFCSIYSWSQKCGPETITATFDSINKNIVKIDSKHVKAKDNILLKITGINSLLHTVSLKYNDFTWYSEPPKHLESLLPNTASIFIGDLMQLEGTSKAAHLESLTKEFEKIITVKSYIDILYKDLKAQTMNSTQINKRCDIVHDSIKNLVITKSEAISGNLSIYHLEQKISYLLFYYETFSEALKTRDFDSRTDTLIHHLSLLKWDYEFLKKHKNYILNGFSIILDGKENGVSNSKTPKKPYYITQEATELTLYIIDRFKPNDTISIFKEDIYRTGRLKLDYSTGIGVNSLLSPTYYVGMSDSIPFIGVEEKRHIDLNIFALLHFNFRVRPSISLGLVTGASISIFDAKPSYVLGFGISIGKQKSISISAGASFGKKDVLSRKVSSNGSTADLKLDPKITEAPTYSKIGIGGFGSITYNLTRVKKKKT